MRDHFVQLLLKHPRLFRAAIIFFSWLVPGNRLRLAVVHRLCLGRRARQCLRHYLAGTQQPISMETADLLAEDAGVRQTLGSHITAQQGKGVQEGVVPVPQYAFANPDWRCALGSVNFHWKQAGANLVIGFEEPYRWDPATSRITRAFHQAAEKMKQHGAGEFQMLGAPAMIRLQELCSTGAGLQVPIDRLYM